MKKAVLGLVTAAMAVVMCVGLVGCGGSAAGIAGKEVTEKQWNSALNYLSKEDSAYSIRCNIKGMTQTSCIYLDEKLSGGQTQTMEMEMSKNGALEHFKGTHKLELSGDMKKIAAAMDTEVTPVNETEESFAQLVENTYIIYTQDDDDKWVTSQRSSSLISDSLEEFTSSLPLSFSSYEYSAALKGYIIKDSLKRNVPYVVKFNGDGQLCAIYYAAEETSKTDICTTTTQAEISIVIDYGEKKITLPTVT